MLFMACYEFSFFVCYVFLWLRLLCPANGLHADLPLQKMHKPCPWITIFTIFTSVLEHPQVVRFPAVRKCLCASGTFVYSWLPCPILHRATVVSACLCVTLRMWDALIFFSHLNHKKKGNHSSVKLDAGIKKTTCRGDRLHGITLRK